MLGFKKKDKSKKVDALIPRPSKEDLVEQYNEGRVLKVSTKGNEIDNKEHFEEARRLSLLPEVPKSEDNIQQIQNPAPMPPTSIALESEVNADFEGTKSADDIPDNSPISFGEPTPEIQEEVIPEAPKPIEEAPIVEGRKKTFMSKILCLMFPLFKKKLTKYKNDK